MEESKELQGFYRIFRAVVYVSVLMEFFEYAIDRPCWTTGAAYSATFTDVSNGGPSITTQPRVQQGRHGAADLHYLYRHQSQETFGIHARRQVLYPLVSGFALLVLSVWLFGHPMETRFYTLPLNIILYMAVSLTGVILVHVALDNISKFLKEGLMKDRFNFENESFEQCEELIETPYSVNIPMRYYYKGKFRKGWTNITNCFVEHG